MTADVGYVLEDSPEGRTLVVTGPWSGEAAGVLARTVVNGLVLNYARGFCEDSLEFLDGRWGVRRLGVLDRGIADLEPIGRLGDSLENLSIQAAPRAQLEVEALPRLRSVAGEWGLIGATVNRGDGLESVITWRFDEVDLHAFRDHVGLRRLMVKDAPHLESLSGIHDLPELAILGIFLARQLRDTSDVAGLRSSFRELELEDCPAVGALDDFEALTNVRFLGFSDCGDIDSLAPIGSLEQLAVLYAWGSTRIVDGDLSPLARLPRLSEIRMRDRRGYAPRLGDIVSSISRRSPP